MGVKASAGSPIGNTATMRIAGSARQSGTCDGARVKNTARNISPNLLLSTRLNTGLLPVPTEDILHRPHDLTQGRTGSGRLDDQLHQVGIAGCTLTQCL
jgi:hypothetical protein